MPPRTLWESLRTDYEGDWYGTNARLAVWHAIACLFLRQDDYPNTPMMRWGFWRQACCIIADRLDAEAERIEKTIIAKSNRDEGNSEAELVAAKVTGNVTGILNSLEQGRTTNAGGYD